LFLFFFFFKDFIHLREREGESAQAGGEAEGEAGSPLSRELDMGLDRDPGIVTRAEGRCLAI